jgi:hypothetical protein
MDSLYLLFQYIWIGMELVESGLVKGINIYGHGLQIGSIHKLLGNLLSYRYTTGKKGTLHPLLSSIFGNLKKIRMKQGFSPIPEDLPSS